MDVRATSGGTSRQRSRRHSIADAAGQRPADVMSNRVCTPKTCPLKCPGIAVKFDERALGGTSDESGEADGEKARGTQMGLPRVCTVRERAGMVVGLSSYG